MTADELIGHNVIGYDIPVAQKLYPWFSIDRDRVTDTLVLSRLIFPNLSDIDCQARAQMEGKLIGSHSLRAWGYRLDLLKGDYTGGFESYSDEMLEYNKQDVAVTERLYGLVGQHEALSKRASVLEHQVAHIVAQQERHGFVFDIPLSLELTATLQVRRAELTRQLQDAFPPWEVKEDFTPKKNDKKRGYVKGVPTFKSRFVEFNPGSRHHIANRLKAMYGWKPKELTDKGQPKVDETVLSRLKYPEAKLLVEYLTIQKRLGMLAEGDNAWQKMVKQNGRIHGEVITNGAVTGRATHRNPNVAQVPKVPKDKDKKILYGAAGMYGYECRQLFAVPKDKVLVGIDVSGLELRMLAHYMGDRQYADVVVDPDGDIHTVNMKAAGLKTRDQAKTFIYAFCYGAGPGKLGSIAGGGAKLGKELQQQFLERTPALNALLLDVKAAASRGYLHGLDGRRLHIRSDHAALNTLLQSAGALVCKQWMVEVDRMLALKGWDVHQVAWIHDECQFECDPNIADEFGQAAVECIRKAGEFFKISVPLTGEYKIGKNWAETH
jgi:DNA polymerase I-like protein with 3'-5' exonuclease and polymerase domains